MDDLVTAGGRHSPEAPGDAVAREQLYLRPGEIAVSRRPLAVRTILGSCVSVCLWDCEQRIGGINHFLLPQGSSPAQRPGRFGNQAVPCLIDQLVELGASRATLRAKVFGGAAQFGGEVPLPTQIGSRNVQVASELLARAQIAIVASDTGGARGRKIVFHTDDGSVSLWEL